MANTFIKNDLIPQTSAVTDDMAVEVDNGTNSFWANAKDVRKYMQAHATVGVGGTFATIEAAIADSTPTESVAFISDVTETGGAILLPDGQDLFINNNGYTWNSGALEITPLGNNTIRSVGGGRLVTTLTASSTAIFHNFPATVSLDLTGFREIHGTANTATGTRIFLGEGGLERLVVANTTIFLHDGTLSGFVNFGSQSALSNLRVVGGGTTCSGFIDTAQGGVFSNINMMGTFNTSQAAPIIDISGGQSVVTDIFNSGSAAWIKFSGTEHEISNFTGNINIDLNIATNSSLSNLTLESLDLSDAACDNNNFKGVSVTNNVVIGGDGNRGIACRFTGTVTINGNNNHFFLSTASSVVDNGTGNFFTNSAEAGGVTSFNTRKGPVLPLLNDYAASLVDNDSTVSGATVKEALENAAAGGSVSQIQQFYQGLAGNDANDGKSVETPKLTLASMITAAGTPTAAAPAELNMIGGQVNTENGAIPAFAALIGRQVEWKGELTMGDQTKLIGHKVLGDGFQDSILIVGAITCYIDLDELSDQSAQANQRLIVASGSAEVHANIRKISSVGTGTSTPWDLSTLSVLYLNCQNQKGNVGVKSGGATDYINVQDYLAANETLVRNENGNIKFVATNKFVVDATANVELDSVVSVKLQQGTAGAITVRPDGIFTGKLDRVFSDSGVGAVVTGSTLVVNSTFSPDIGQYILSYTTVGNSAFRHYTIFSVASNTNFTLDELAGTATTDWTAATNGSDITLGIANNSVGTLTFHWEILRIVN